MYTVLGEKEIQLFVVRHIYLIRPLLTIKVLNYADTSDLWRNDFSY